MEVFRLKLNKELQYKENALKDAKNMIAQLQKSSESWKSVRDSAIGGGGTAAVAARTHLDKGADGSNTPQRSGAIDAGDGLSGRRSQLSSRSGDSRQDAKATKYPTSPLSVSTQGMNSPHGSSSSDLWAAMAEVAVAVGEKSKEGEVSKVHVGKSSNLKIPDTAKTDLAYVSEEDDDYDEDELEEHWGKTDAIMLVVNNDGNMRPSLKKDVQEEQNSKTEEHKGHTSVGGKKNSGPSAVALKPHHEKGLAHTASSVPMSEYAKKALGAIGAVSYLTRAGRLHLAADKLALKLLQGCD